jgi:hypothetical protein
MQQALALEIREASKDSSSNIYVTNGQFIAPAEDGFLYSFRADVKASVPPESSVKFIEKGKHDVKGIWVAQDKFEVLVILSERLAPSTDQGRLKIDMTYILESLSNKLGEATTGPGAFLLDHLLNRTGAQTNNRGNHTDQTLFALRNGGQQINRWQEDAIRNCLKESIHFVWGPPGTGKTANLSHVCRALCEENEKILVVAHANAAVDVAMLRIAAAMADHSLLKNGKILRIGFTNNRDVRHHAHLSVMGFLQKTNPGILSRLESLEEQTAIIQNQMRSASTDHATSLESDLKAIRKEVQAIRAQIRDIEGGLITDAQIIGCTAAKTVIDDRIWLRNTQAVVFDEVSMMNFPYVAAIGSRAERRILQFGDFRQLPPIVLSEDAIAKKWLATDSFHISGVATSIENSPHDSRITMLEEQYRMHSSICKVVSSLSYNHRLRTANHVDDSVVRFSRLAPEGGQPLILADSTQFQSVCLKESPTDPKRSSRANPIHAILALNLAHNFIEQGETDVCIISPYRAQARLTAAIADQLNINIPIATVHKFQGAEQAVVIFDVCDSSPQTRASALTGHDSDLSRRLINVGMSRARGKLIFLVDYKFVLDCHDGISQTEKACAHITQTGVRKELALDELDNESSPFEWFDNFSDAQISLAREFSSAKKLLLNVPAAFRLSSVVDKAMQLTTGHTGDEATATRRGKVDFEKTANSGCGFYAIMDHGAFLGGHDAAAPIVLIRGDISAPLDRVFAGNHSQSYKNVFK